MMIFKRVLAAVTLTAAVLSCTGCLKYSSNILEVTRLNNVNPSYAPGGNVQPGINVPQVTVPVAPSGFQPVIPSVMPSQNYPSVPVVPSVPVPSYSNEEVTNPEEQDNPANWTIQQIVSYSKTAVNKTKAYKNAIKVNHKESLKCDVTKCPFESLLMPIANKIIAGVVKPTDEIMNFSNGQTVNSEGATVPLLLPKRGAFTLDASGVARATAQRNGNDTVIHIQLVKEVGTLTEHPKHNAASVGYLDAADVDLGPVKLDYLNITYSGTTIDMTVNKDGYVTQVIYKIPIDIDCKAKVLGKTAEVTCVGEQREDWIVKW